MNLPQHDANSTENGPEWQPIAARERRVAGVLIEKAKTTPSAYPLTLNAIKTGCNQKSNRYPVMQLEEDDLQDALDNLREMGAVTEIMGGGRVAKFRHLLYEWLGVDKVELAVMGELLLRGAQTVGELRGRSARMEPIADLAALRPVMSSLHQKGLLLYLTPEGRGCVVTHALYRPPELERVRAQYAEGAVAATNPAGEVPASLAPTNPSPTPAESAPATSALADLRHEFESLQADYDGLREELGRRVEELRRDLDDVKQQLGI